MDGHVNEEFPRRRRVTGRRRIKLAVYLFAAFIHHWPAPMAPGVNITAHFVWSHVASLAARRTWLGKFSASTRPPPPPPTVGRQNLPSSYNMWGVGLVLVLKPSIMC